VRWREDEMGISNIGCVHHQRELLNYAKSQENPKASLLMEYLGWKVMVECSKFPLVSWLISTPNMGPFEEKRLYRTIMVPYLSTI